MRLSMLIGFCLCLFMLGFAAVGAPGAFDEESKVTLHMEFYRLQGEVLGELWPADEGAAGTGDSEPAVRLFERAELQIGGILLEANDDGWSWNGQDRPGTSGRVELIAAPRVTLPLPHSFEVVTRPDSGVEYFEKRPDGLFELKRIEEHTGLSLATLVEPTSGGQLILRDLRLDLTLVDQREELDGVTLDVGAPVLRHLQHEMTIQVALDKNHGILLSTEGNGFLLMRIRAEAG